MVSLHLLFFLKVFPKLLAAFRFRLSLQNQAAPKLRFDLNVCENEPLIFIYARSFSEQRGLPLESLPPRVTRSARAVARSWRGSRSRCGLTGSPGWIYLRWAKVLPLGISPPPAKSQHHRMVGVGRDLCGSPSPTPCRSRVTQSRLHRTNSSCR